MNNKLFVRNLDYSVNDSDLNELFAQHGTVISVSIAKDRDTGRPRGFAFIEMESQTQGEAAIKALDGRQLKGREISVAVSQPKSQNFNRNRY